LEQRNDLVRIEHLYLKFEGLLALRDVSLTVKKGEILGLIGPNGAGKTCILNCINGIYHPYEGQIYFKGEEITKLKPHAIPGLGIARVFQNIELFGGMTVLENLMAGRHLKMTTKFWNAALYFGKTRREEIEHRTKVEEIIKFLEIESERHKPVNTLPYGLRKRTDIGRALCLEPELLLMDEPMAGMNVEEKEDIARFILDTQELKGTTIVIVEHDMGAVLDITDRVVCMDFGNVIAEGPAAEVCQDPKTLKAYLGEEGQAS
jgi:branched-chain amino acid transport system ATP-binding protein